MIALPIDEAIPELFAVLASRNVAVLQAPPGAGKTTRIPLALHAARGGEANWLGVDNKILMLEPRRLAARTAARWMAQQLGEPVGGTVGYRTRLDTKVSPATRIEVVTEGILTRILQSDPALSGYGAVIFDEFHERSLNADLGLALVRESQLALREDLRVLVMSATLDGAPVAALLSDAERNAAPMITSAGRAFPVTTKYYAPAKTNDWLDHLIHVLPEILATEEGSVLVFLPGAGEIRRVQSQLTRRLPENIRVLPLYGELVGDAQDEAIAPAKPGTRKVVLATSIAETSLTIDGVRVVVDAGWQRRASFDVGSAMSRLVTRRVSQAAADQRRGRAGRTSPGVCIRLWGEHEALSPFTASEILEADLSGFALELAQWGVRDARTLSWLDLPPLAAYEQALSLLRLLGAVDEQGAITSHGNRLLDVGLAPRLAHLVVRGRELSHAALAASIAAVLSERDFLGRETGVDLRTRLDVLRGDHGEQALRVDRQRISALRDSARRLYSKKSNEIIEQQETTETVGLLLALAYPDRIARRRGAQGHRYLLANGRGALLPEGDALAKHDWLVCADLDGDAREAKIFLAAPVTQSGILAQLAANIVEEDFVGWDSTGESVVARRRRKLGALVLEEVLLAAPSPEQIQAALLIVIREQGLHVLPWNEACRQWRARVQLLHGLDPAGWPDLSDTALLAGLEEWLAPFLGGMAKLAHLKNLPLHDALRTLLPYAAQKQLDALAPAHWAVPTGSSLPIDYCAENGPVLAVKLQEMFGAMQTPAVVAGRVPLTLHLLSPAQRPVAVTRNLATFWEQGYPDVRKDLRGRYPKHPWPEDPLMATPQRGVKRKPE